MNTHWHGHLAWIDAQRSDMERTLLKLCAINTGSWNLTGLEQMKSVIRDLLKVLPGQIQEHVLAPVQQLSRTGECIEKPLASALSYRCRPEAPIQILLVGHLDTVFPVDHPFQQHQYLDQNTLNAPGAADLKGGLLVALTALRALEQSEHKANIGWELLFNTDEEIGSPGSAALLTQAAKRHHIGLCYEPSLPTGELVSGRKGSGNFQIHVRGRAAHAGREHHLGRNAIIVAARISAQLDALNGQCEDMTVNVGFIDGGGSVNAVPDHCLVKINVRVSHPNQQAQFENALQKALDEANRSDGFHATAIGGFHRPPKLVTPAIQQLLDMLKVCGAQMNLPIQWQSTGGCCDGNNLAAAGLANVDNLGVRGGKIHSGEEFALLDSLTERAKLSALLLLKLASGEFQHEHFRTH